MSDEWVEAAPPKEPTPSCLIKRLEEEEEEGIISCVHYSVTEVRLLTIDPVIIIITESNEM